MVCRFGFRRMAHVVTGMNISDKGDWLAIWGHICISVLWFEGHKLSSHITDLEKVISSGWSFLRNFLELWPRCWWVSCFRSRARPERSVCMWGMCEPNGRERMAEPNSDSGSEGVFLQPCCCCSRRRWLCPRRVSLPALALCGWRGAAAAASRSCPLSLTGSGPCPTVTSWQADNQSLY